MIFLKYLLLAISICSFVYGIAIMFPAKMKLAKKYGFDKTNADLIELAKRGNQDLIEFYRRSKIFLIVFVGSGALFALLHNLIRG